MMKRYFIALPVSDKVRQSLIQLQKHLNNEFSQVISWILPINVHLTIQFLGMRPPEVVLQVRESIRCCLPASFRLTLQSIDIFCHCTKPSILFVRTSKPASLMRLVSCVRTATKHIVAQDQMFVPHITLGRFRKLTSKESVLQYVQSVVLEPQCWEINRVNIYVSEQTESGLTYPIVHSLDLI